MKQKFFSQISDHQQSVAPAPSRGLPHTPQLCWWSLISYSLIKTGSEQQLYFFIF
jgi:hypothetical protein